MKSKQKLFTQNFKIHFFYQTITRSLKILQYFYKFQLEITKKV